MKLRNHLALVLLLFLGAALAGCATGGGGKSRGSLSQATRSSADSGTKENAVGRDQGRSRTKTDHQDQDQGFGDNSYQDDYYEEEDSGGGFLFGLILSLFSSDDEEEEYDPYDYKTFSDTTADQGEYETWTDADEFGMSQAGDREASEDGREKAGSGLDIKRSNLNFWFSPSTLGGDVIQGFTTYTLMYSAYTGRQYRAHAGLYYGRGKKGSQENIQEGIRWFSEGGLDLGTRGYFTSDRSQLGFYMILGMRTGAVSWSYVNAIEASNPDGTTESVSKDSLWLFVPYAGLGSSLLQTKKVHLGLNFTVGPRLYLDETFEGYSNDLFKNVMEYKLNLEASFFF